MICGFPLTFSRGKHEVITTYCAQSAGLTPARPQGRALVCQHGDTAHWLRGKGRSSVLVPPHPVPPGGAGSEPVFWGSRTQAGTPPCSGGFRVFQFCVRFLFFFSPPISPSSPGIMRHVLVNVMQWTFTKTHLVSATQFFFNAVYSPVNSLCKI